MGERSSNFRDIHLHKKANKYGRELDLANLGEKFIFIRRRTNMGERSSNLRDIHIFIRRRINMGERSSINSSSKEGEFKR